ncbi:hypothetical protein HPY86_04275 [candidate division WOR-3 bacterium]|nr:hypothetical protein [candidate division WOR-3 bacterium]
MNKNEVNTAFEILIEEIEEVSNLLDQEAEKMVKGRDYEKVKNLAEYGERLKNFREKVKALQDEWQNIFSTVVPKSKRRRRQRGKLGRGLRTPESEFFKPILQSLVELGGKAEMQVVLKKVYEKMKHILTPYDFQPLKSTPTTKRWENTAQWARYTMVNEGLLKPDSPRGVWEITEKGRKYLQNS